MASREVHLNLDRNALPNEPRIDKIVNDIISELGAQLTNPEDRDRLPGVAVAVRLNRKLVHLNCYGYANLETGKKITLDTIFDLGSLSKQFTAMAVLDCEIFKLLDLKDPLSKFFKGLPRYADSITIEDLIHHTSGLPDYTKLHVASRRAAEDWYETALAKPNDWYPKMLKKRKKEITNKDVLRWIASQKLLAKDPDTEFDYSNSGYVVLAELVARVTNMRFADFLNQVIFSQFQMPHTYVFDELSRFSTGAPEIVNHAKCYNRVSDRFVPVGYTPLNFITGDGNIHSTIEDLATWEVGLHQDEMQGLKVDGKTTREVLWAPVQLKNRKKVDYGLGWNLLNDKFDVEVEENGKRVTRKYESRAEYHRGLWLAWHSYFARGSRWVIPKTGKSIDPKTFESLGIVVLSNNHQFNTCRIARDISRLYWGPLKKDNIMNNFNCG
jgi:CubicO group peptidase (beta-lactamase class C family)